jgi:hypothetical protein
MGDELLDADELLRSLADAWRSAGKSKDFTWDADLALQSLLRRLTNDMPSGTAVVAETDSGPALLLVSNDNSALVRITDRGAEAIFLGALVGGRFRETEEQIDTRHSAITIRFEHERIPGGYVEHHAVSAQQRRLQERLHPVLRAWSTPVLSPAG